MQCPVAQAAIPVVVVVFSARQAYVEVSRAIRFAAGLGYNSTHAY